MEIALRLATGGDAEAIACLVNRAYRPGSGLRGWTHEAELVAGERASAAMVRSLLRRGSALLVLCRGDSIVACVHVEAFPAERAAYIGMLATEPAEQAGGLGKRMLACAERWPGQVHAFHVHHGLQVAADDFERHCIALCMRLGLPLSVQRVDARHAPGQSPEDAARQARYKAFEALAHDRQAQSTIQTIALAQHADDQVETLLLALSRGAGVAGLAAMPAHWQRGGLHWQRPLLGVAGQEVRAWLRARGQAWVEDPTNSDERYTRNRIRRQLLPALQPKLVLGENISQAAQFATSGSAQGGIVAQSLALAPQVGRLGRFALIPANWHQPLTQRMVVLKEAPPAAQAWDAFLASPASLEIMRRYGFDVPRP